MDASSKKFLYKYLNCNSPTGFEKAGQEIWLEYIRPFVDEYITDTYGTAVGIVNPSAEYRVVIEAHADEIAWYVNYISDKGYLYVIRNGGSDYQIAPSMRVIVHSSSGRRIPGVFGWPAVHVRDKKEEPKPKEDTITVDCGCQSRDEVEELGIQIGNVVTFDEYLTELNRGKFLVGRALDNRIGGFMIAEAVKRIRENNIHLPYGLYATNAVQEEIGLKGAEMIAHKIRPHLALVTDVTHDTQSPLYNKIKQGDISLGKGPVLITAPAVHNNVLKLLKETAEENKIGYQRAVSSRATGTDTDAFAYSNSGVASALIALPLKYMHTTVEMVSLRDIEALIELIYRTLLEIKPGQDFRYIK
ncbi:MAG: M20/M25/M40 family metallo-hydrolase [Cytophagales bacterium]|nr:M20/M25/M40 family metallo-hydrolase [Cytophagales bacterium]